MCFITILYRFAIIGMANLYEEISEDMLERQFEDFLKKSSSSLCGDDEDDFGFPHQIPHG